MSKSASPLASPGRGLRNNLKNLKESLRFLKPSSSTSKILLTKKEDQNKFSTEQGIPHSVNDNCQIDCPCVEFLSPDEARILKKKSKSEKNLIDAAEEEMQPKFSQKTEQVDEKVPEIIEEAPKFNTSFFGSSRNYEKGPIIGMGSFGRVFLATDLANDKKFAIKEIAFKKGFELEFLEKQMEDIQNEISLLKKFSHPNIVRYYGAEIINNSPDETPTLNIFLEYVGGGSLSNIITKMGKLDEKLTKFYTIQILTGLKYLHDNRVVHRDIKAANILVEHLENGETTLKLSDFGTSKQLDKDRNTGHFKTLVGTCQFMAPEVILQTGHGRRADIWSLGCLICEMLTGFPPFVEFKTHFAIMNQIVTTNEPPSLPDFVSAIAKEFLLRCFERDPLKRATCDELLSHPWLKISSEEIENESAKEPELQSDLSTQKAVSEDL